MFWLLFIFEVINYVCVLLVIFSFYYRSCLSLLFLFFWMIVVFFCYVCFLNYSFLLLFYLKESLVSFGNILEYLLFVVLSVFFTVLFKWKRRRRLRWIDCVFLKFIECSFNFVWDCIW